MGRPKTYKINEEYFNTFMTEHKSYLLGLIMSDGHLDYKRGMFEYACAIKDISIIRFIKDELESTHPIHDFIVKNRTYCRYAITNVKLVRGLIDKYSLPHSNKSKNNIDIPCQLTDNLVPHFLRGFFDGDGSIWFGGGTYRASYTGGEKMVKSIQLVLDKIGIPSYFSYRYSEENKNSCNITVNGTLNVERLGIYLYKNATCFLDRKHQKFVDCNVQSKYVKARSFSMSGNENKTKTLYLGGMTQAEIARKLELAPSSVRGCVQRLRRKNQLV